MNKNLEELLDSPSFEMEELTEEELREEGRKRFIDDGNGMLVFKNKEELEQWKKKFKCKTVVLTGSLSNNPRYRL